MSLRQQVPSVSRRQLRRRVMRIAIAALEGVVALLFMTCCFVAVFAASMAACHPVTTRTAASAITAGVNVRDYGAVGDGATDDRAAIQAAIEAGAGSAIVFPAGRYLVTQAPSSGGTWALRVAGDQTSLLGQPGAVLVQAAGSGPNVRVIQVDADGVTIDGITFEGQKPAQTPAEHRAAVFATGASGLVLHNLIAQNFSGDGFYLSLGSNSVRLDHVTARWNTRNGLTLGGGTVGTVIEDSQFIGNGAQQADSEPGGGTHADGVTFRRCTFDALGASWDWVLTVSGGSAAPDDRSRSWLIEDNTINGGVNVMWAQDVAIRNNRGTNASTVSSVRVYRSSDQIEISGNVVASTGAAPAVFEVFGTQIGQIPDHVTIDRNVLTTVNPAFGIAVRAGRTVTITGNRIRGAGVVQAFNAGILARATVVGADVVAVIVRGNAISDFGAYGFSASSNPGRVLLVDVTGNVFDDTAGTMPAAMTFDTAHDVRQSDNLNLGGVTTMVLHAPTGSTRSSWGTGDRWVTP